MQCKLDGIETSNLLLVERRFILCTLHKYRFGALLSITRCTDVIVEISLKKCTSNFE